MTAWIKMIADEEASPDLMDALNEARTPHGTVDNVMRVHSLRPNTMRGHVKLYRAALHNDANTVPMWLQETIASYVSILNDCDYSLGNHWANARHLIADDERADKVEAALKDDAPEHVFEGAELAIDTIDAAWACPVCDQRMPRGAVLRCATCEKPARLVQGDEIILERIEMEAPHV